MSTIFLCEKNSQEGRNADAIIHSAGLTLLGINFVFNLFNGEVKMLRPNVNETCLRGCTAVFFL